MIKSSVFQKETIIIDKNTLDSNWSILYCLKGDALDGKDHWYGPSIFFNVIIIEMYSLWFKNNSESDLIL